MKYKLFLGPTKVCECAACGERFTTPGNFDQHRSGLWEARICLNPAEVGMSQNRLGYWLVPYPNGRKWLSPKPELGAI
ncbi:MAG: hypothetical protein ACREHG_06345 [Candidatus Saccharimonadales bacterium]